MSYEVKEGDSLISFLFVTHALSLEAVNSFKKIFQCSVCLL